MPWSLAYAHDKDGNAVEGSLDALIAAIERGCPVRYFVDYQPLSPGVYKEAQAVWIDNGHVIAQNTVSVSAAGPTEDLGGPATAPQPYPDFLIRFLDDAYHFYEIACTTGDVDMTRWSVGEHKMRRRNQMKFAMKWFVGE